MNSVNYKNSITETSKEENKDLDGGEEEKDKNEDAAPVTPLELIEPILTQV